MDAGDSGGAKVVGFYIAVGDFFADSEILVVRRDRRGKYTATGGMDHKVSARLIEETDTNIRILESIADALRGRQDIA